jgi:hypothetical protein
MKSLRASRDPFRFARPSASRRDNLVNHVLQRCLREVLASRAKGLHLVECQAGHGASLATACIASGNVSRSASMTKSKMSPPVPHRPWQIHSCRSGSTKKDGVRFRAVDRALEIATPPSPGGRLGAPRTRLSQREPSPRWQRAMAACGTAEPLECSTPTERPDCQPHRLGVVPVIRCEC